MSGIVADPLERRRHTFRLSLEHLHEHPQSREQQATYSVDAVVRAAHAQDIDKVMVVRSTRIDEAPQGSRFARAHADPVLLTGWLVSTCFAERTWHGAERRRQTASQAAVLEIAPYWDGPPGRA